MRRECACEVLKGQMEVFDRSGKDRWQRVRLGSIELEGKVGPGGRETSSEVNESTVSDKRNCDC